MRVESSLGFICEKGFAGYFFTMAGRRCVGEDNGDAMGKNGSELRVFLWPVCFIQSFCVILHIIMYELNCIAQGWGS